jgi:hypothetical protein
VSRADLTVTVEDATRVYGAADPAFTARIDGFVNQETNAVLGGSLVFITAATVSSGVDSYAISASGLTSTNYTIDYIDGFLSVTPAA